MQKAAPSHLPDDLIDSVEGSLISCSVRDPDAHAKVQQPVVDCVLTVIEEEAGGVRTVLCPDDVDETTTGAPQCFLAQSPAEQLTLPDEHLRRGGAARGW